MQKAAITIYNSREELENTRAVEAFQSTYTQRFFALMKLIKISNMISKAKIIKSPIVPNQ